MFGIFKRSTIELHFYTDNKMVYDCFPIRPASEYFPQWWRDLPKYPKIPDWNTPSTMKGCNGILDLHKNSFVIPLWCELMLKREYVDDRPDIKLMFANDSFTSQCHPNFQFTGLLDHDRWSIHKLMNPWVIQCQENLRLLSHDCSYHRGVVFGDVVFFPGISDPYMEPELNPFLAVKHDMPDTVMPAGMPLIYLTPVTDRRVKIFCHYDPIKHNTERSGFFSFYNKGSKKNRQMQLSKNKHCPFQIG